MAKLFKRFAKHRDALRSTIASVRGNIGKSIPVLQQARAIDHENFRAVRNVMNLMGRERANVDRLYTAINLIADCKPAADPIIRSLLSSSESQLCQDILCVLAFNQKRSGYFVEIGVGEGKSISNTYLLEKDFDWKGLLIEPCRSFHASIKKQRKAILDKRAASSSQSGEIEFSETTDNGEFSFTANAKDASGKAPAKKQYETYQVPTTTLDAVLTEHGAPTKIDFISLDTEGSERDILDGLNLDKYQIGLFCIEHNQRPGALADFDALLLPRGYRRILPLVSNYDAFYLHKSVISDHLF